VQPGVASQRGTCSYHKKTLLHVSICVLDAASSRRDWPLIAVGSWVMHKRIEQSYTNRRPAFTSARNSMGDHNE
jgi:hypothetical protein